jgi:hypothetical protein
MRWDAVVFGAALAGALAWLARRDHARARAWRSHLFDDCVGLLERTRVRIDRTGWPVLEGDFEGLPVSLSLILDDAGYRKLPVLWLSVTLGARLALEAAFDALAREQGTEFYSPANELPERLPLPPEWPRHVSLRADRPAVTPAALALAGGRFFADAQAKEIVVSSRGVRMVRLVAEGRRAEYLVLRRSRFDLERLDPVLAGAVLAATSALARALAAEADDGRRRAA